MRSLLLFRPRGRLLLKVIALRENVQDPWDTSESEFQVKAGPTCKERACRPVSMLFAPVIPEKVMGALGLRVTQGHSGREEPWSDPEPQTLLSSDPKHHGDLPVPAGFWPVTSPPLFDFSYILTSG